MNFLIKLDKSTKNFLFQGVHVIAVTISNEQLNFAKTNDTEADELEFLRVPGLGQDGSGSFEFQFKDYRDVDETFDRIYSVGMFEHVGVGSVFSWNSFLEGSNPFFRP